MSAIDNIIVSEMNSLIQRIKDNISTNGRTASGASADSLRLDVSIGEPSVFTLWGASWFNKLEKGTSPEEATAQKGFYYRILEWMRAKGISSNAIAYKRLPSARWQPKYTPEERGERAKAGAITGNIKKKGTRIFQQGGVTNIYTDSVDETDEAIREMIDYEMNLLIVKTIKL